MRRYDHVERLGHSEVDGLTMGTVYVFPKLDGANGSVWMSEDGLKCASRNRELTADKDNHGFYAWVHGDDPRAQTLRTFVGRSMGIVVYGEWMVPHTLKSYRPDTWRRFWIFDVWSSVIDGYIPYESYAPALKNLDLVEPLCTIQNPTDKQLRAQVETNTYLIQDGAGVGEGVVLKNYEWRNQHGRQPWAKIVRNEFKEQNRRAFGVPEKSGEFQVELAIAEKYCTPELVGKTRAKVVADVANSIGADLMEPNTQRRIEEGYRGRVVPQLLGRVFHDLVVEESWAFVKEHRNPTINFQLLQKACIAKVKEYAQDLF